MPSIKEVFLHIDFGVSSSEHTSLLAGINYEENGMYFDIDF